MEFHLLDSIAYSGLSDIKKMERMIERLDSSTFKKKFRVDSYVNILGDETKDIYIEIKTLDELKELYKLFNDELILNFNEKYPHIAIYDGYIE